MMQGLALVCLIGSLDAWGQTPAQPVPSSKASTWEFDLLGRFNQENREQRLEQYRSIQTDVERAGGKLAWTQEEVRQFASERGLSFVHGMVPAGKENDLTLSHMILGAVLWKESTEPPTKGKSVQVEARLITGGDDKELVRRWRNSRTLMAEQGFQEAYGYDNFHFQRLIGSIPAEKLSPILRSMNKDAAGKNSDFAPVSLLIAGPEATYQQLEKPFPPEGNLRKIPPDSRSIFSPPAPKTADANKPEVEADTAKASGPIRLEVILNRVVPLTVAETVADLPWWPSLGDGAILEGRIGPLLSVRVSPEQALKIAQQPDVAVVRLPRDAVRLAGPGPATDSAKATTTAIPSKSNVPGARLDYRSPLVVIIHDDFRGWEKEIPAAQMLDFTRERNSFFIPDPFSQPADAKGDGTLLAAKMAQRSPGTRIIMVRIDSRSPAMLGRMLQAMRGGALQDGLLAARSVEISTENARLSNLRASMLDEQESLYQNAEGDTEQVVTRKAEIREALAKIKNDIQAANSLDRELQLHRGRLMELATANVVLSGLAWAEGHPLDGSATLTRYLDDALAKKIIWFQATPDLSPMVWSGTAYDTNHNQLLEFAPRVQPSKAHDAEFLPLVWGKKEGATSRGSATNLTLSEPATIRLTLQWRESVRSELVQNYPSLLDEPIRAMRLLVVRKMSGQGSDTVWNPVALADGAAQKILQDAHSATWEQQLTVALAESGEYALQIEGSPPRNSVPDVMGATPASTFTPVTPMRILARTLQGSQSAYFSFRGLDSFDTPAWLPVPSQARRALAVATRSGNPSNPANSLEPDRRAKPELVVGSVQEALVLDALAQSGAEVVQKLGKGESPELIDWVMHRKLGWLPASAYTVQPAQNIPELGTPSRSP